MLPVVCAVVPEGRPDETEFESFVNEYQSLMIGAANRVLGNYHDSEDAVINALAAIAKRFSVVASLPPDARRAYAARSARNCALNILNARNRRRESETFTQAEMPDADVENDIDALLDRIVFEDAVKCILKLDDVYCDVLYLYYVDGLTAPQIAHKLALNRKTVESRILRGKRMLRELMKGDKK